MDNILQDDYLSLSNQVYHNYSLMFTKSLFMRVECSRISYDHLNTPKVEITIPQ
jgi:hypothetical protein